MKTKWNTITSAPWSGKWAMNSSLQYHNVDIDQMKGYLNLTLRKIAIWMSKKLAIFFLMTRFWHFLNIQMAIFRRVRFEPYSRSRLVRFDLKLGQIGTLWVFFLIWTLTLCVRLYWKMNLISPRFVRFCVHLAQFDAKSDIPSSFTWENLFVSQLSYSKHIFILYFTIMGGFITQLFSV